MKSKLDMKFELWWNRLLNIALRERVKLGDKESYLEYFNDGDSPEKTVRTEIKHQKKTK